MHDNNINLVFAAMSWLISFLFGIELGVAFCALAGAFLSLRFCEPKSTRHQIVDVVISTILSCIITGSYAVLITEIKSDSPITHIPLKILALILGFLILLVAEHLYTSVKEISLKKMLKYAWDQLMDRWQK